MDSNLRKIRYRFLYDFKSTLISKYNKFYTKAETFNDIIELSYQKMIEIANQENINLSDGNFELESFSVNDNFDFPIKIKKKYYDVKLNKDQKIFHIDFRWCQIKKLNKKN